MKGIDCSVKITQSAANTLSDQGIQFACRYLVPERYATKRLTKPEAEIITNEDMQILSVFETTANRASGGAISGTTDGQLAFAEAKAIGQPIGSAIYFAVDYDAQYKDYDTIESYLRHAFCELPGYAIGVYGSYAVIEEMSKRCACTHFWQTYAWSKGKKSIKANVYQYKNGVSIAGIPADLNESFGNEGFWKVSINPMKLLKQGMNCEEVKTLQTLLNKYGYKLTVDGDFGLITAGSVKDFQRQHNLADDGIVGQNTWSKLKN